METHCFGQMDEIVSQVVPKNINPYSLLYMLATSYFLYNKSNADILTFNLLDLCLTGRDDFNGSTVAQW